jgi:hypothetical protein
MVITYIYHMTVDESIKNQNDKTFISEYNFLTPLEYHEHGELSKIVISDLELDGRDNIMQTIHSNNDYHLLLHKHSSLFSKDKTFLKQNQSFIEKLSYCDKDINSFLKYYVEYKNEPDFLNKYQYVQFEKFSYLNRHALALHVIGLYSFSSPFLSLLSPIIGLILPYIILWIRGMRVGFGTYFQMAKRIIFDNYIIHRIRNFHRYSIQQNAYTVFSIMFYIMNVYSNVILCINYYNSLNYLSNFMEKYNEFLVSGKELLNNFKNQTKSFSKFSPFLNNLNYHEQNIDKMIQEIQIFCTKTNKMSQYGFIGSMLKCNYEIFNDDNKHETIMYIIYLNQFMYNMNSIKTCVSQNKMNKCKYIKSHKKRSSPKISNGYYISYMHQDENHCVKNDIDLSNNLIITGPNASGKTTTIKSVLINLFLSQSCGYGCYDKCKMELYDNFYSYLNIPDTSNRDSLFQAEARRCKDIISKIEKKQDEKHFCIFDEIYSGTNPNDAVLCANVYLKGMNLYKHCVDYIITTHYVELCQKLDSNKLIMNKRMKVEEEDKKLIYTYIVEDGISRINGGFQVLKDLKYPDYLLNLHEI